MPGLFELAALALVAGQQVVAPAPALDIGAAQQIAHRGICYRLATAQAYPLDLRDCLAFALSPDAAFKTEVCNFLRDTAQLADFDFSSFAECLREQLAPR